MKKMICLIVVLLFFVVSCQYGLAPEEGKIYSMNIVPKDIAYAPAGILELSTFFELPESRVNNFYNTLKIIFENSNNFRDIHYSLMLFFETESDNRINLFSSDGHSLNVIENNNFDTSIIDSKNKNYYMMSVELPAYIPPTEKTEECNLYLRELKIENNKSAIAVMIEQKNSSNIYEYLTDFILEGMEIHPSFGNKQELPYFLE